MDFIYFDKNGQIKAKIRDAAIFLILEASLLLRWNKRISFAVMRFPVKMEKGKNDKVYAANIIKPT
jgi:hypothetical protein